MDNTTDRIISVVEDATFDFTMGDHDIAISKLQELLAEAPDAFEAWHALCEIYYADKSKALAPAEKAYALRPNDLYINTSLSRIWLEKGSKAQAERFGAQARMASWKDQLTNPDAAPGKSIL